MKFKKFKFKKVKSTNNTAIRIIKSLKCKYGMVVSDTQIMGRGQYGKKWIDGKTIIKEIVVPKKLVNFVIKG